MSKKMLKEDYTVVAVRIFIKYMACSTSKTEMSRLMIITASRATSTNFRNERWNYIFIL